MARPAHNSGSEGIDRPTPSDELWDEEDAPESASRSSLTNVSAPQLRVKAAWNSAIELDRTLRDLHRTVKFLGASVQGAIAGNAQTSEELSRLKSGIEGDVESTRALEARVRELEGSLEAARAAAREERRRLIEEQDAFIASLLADQQQVLSRVCSRLAWAEERLAMHAPEALAEAAASGFPDPPRPTASQPAAATPPLPAVADPFPPERRD